MTTSLVSIGLPVFNGEEFLQETLDSLLRQSHQNFEIIICDNASTDKTKEICKQNALKDRRIKYIRNDSNIGGTLNAKKTVDVSNGEYFMWAACHDLWSENFIEKCLLILEQEASVVLCHARSMWIDTHSEVMGYVDGAIDTRGLDRKQRINFVSWAFQNGAPIFGLFRMNIIRQLNLGEIMLAPDRAAIYETAFFGDIACTNEAKFYFRQTEKVNSVNVYIKKMIGRNVKSKEKKTLMRALYKAHLLAIIRHYKSRLSWPGLMMNCIYALNTRYRHYFD